MKTVQHVGGLLGLVCCIAAPLSGCAKTTRGPGGVTPKALSAISTYKVTLDAVSGEVTASNDEFIQFQCQWTETDANGNDIPRRFDAFLWAPPSGEAKVTIPASANEGLDLNSGYLLMQGVDGTRPRSKSGGGNATGNGTTIVLWAGTDGGDPIFRAVCVGGSITVNQLRGKESSTGMLFDLGPQIIDDGFYFEWDGDRVSETTGYFSDSALPRKISNNSDLETDIDKLLNRTRTTPDD